MLRASLTVSVLLVLTGRLSAQDQPTGPPPRIMAASVDMGRPYLLTYVAEHRKEKRAVTVIENGKGVPREVEVVVQVMVPRRVALDGPGLEVYDTDGKRLDPKQLKLQGPTAVLVSADGRPVDRFFLRLARPGTLVVVSRDLVNTMQPFAPPPPLERKRPD
jgi:hypothetical protein